MFNLFYVEEQKQGGEQEADEVRSKETGGKDLSPRHELENKFKEPVPEI